MQIKQFDIWLANLNPAKGTEPGKTRPVVVVQTNLLNGVHPSSIICPITSNVLPQLEILRVHLNTSQLDKASDILIDQMRAIDNRRLISKLGELTKEQVKLVKQNLKVVLDL
ncbi:type II toxin-antitoxin system PemK/MazF family toxin [Pedobacter sp. SL55]|uniref:type II toxin-antitoxin system PemK/MazF family toxin n=1 Tax=Pedobacter sp. SL55 TaxID=2995161 RepID=UPI002271623C|nr:type II toxin-antitoxin system PemK/MazF family toxin [Pedobacter sp. SL55]WAC39109.1 type II toxin-antitoxin system PemK/MazF family toxin [Pedobacter sp. SL55]